ncbi:MAG: nucleotidyltransferase [Chloroflexi bacterium]|nr:nucleotidyltransferase [Chloroflexota bacterium]MYC02358.1 nucleotidyltransferase [Chloroflexota bacterium]
MPIQESILATWAAPVDTSQSARTYEAVARVLNGHRFQFGLTHSIYLQGSYANHTNIRRDSDIDVVIELTNRQNYDVNSLSSADQQAVNAQYSTMPQGLTEFKNEVVDVLRHSFGQEAVTVGNKAIRLEPLPGPLPADIIVCQTYRRYRTARSYSAGIVFWTRDGERIVNFPRQHRENGAAKNDLAHTWYKPTIRMFKSARTHLENTGYLPNGTAPSYCIECLLYNVPEHRFGFRHGQTFVDVVNWLDETQMDDFVCQNELQWLFKGASADWTISSAKHFVSAMIDLWNASA